MPIFTEQDEPEFAALQASHGWFAAVLLADYGELDTETPSDVDIPEALNWLLLVPSERRYDFEVVECSLAFTAPDGSYRCTVWDVVGMDDDPWAVFLVDELGPRLLPEYSVFDENADEHVGEDALRRASKELPERLEAGEFNRGGDAVDIPDWLMVPPEEM